MAKKEVIYREQARIYDLIYSKKDYKKDSKKIIELIKKNKKSKGNGLLEVACGTGNYLRYFKKDFSCMRLDVNEGILKIAKKKLPKIKLVKGNMINFNLNKKFDIILCLFSSIGYVKTSNNLKKTIRNFTKHLNKGGVVVINPWFTKSSYKIGTPHLDTYSDENIKIARASISRKKGNISIMDFHFLVTEKNKGVTHFIDRHELGMFEYNKISKIIKESGLKSKFIKEGRGLFIGIKK